MMSGLDVISRHALKSVNYYGLHILIFYEMTQLITMSRIYDKR